ncbi:MAG: 16S rRNA (cytosine(1402)-N(4))-methyltransferase, partial [Candidatus Weimeria sp.]
SKGYQLTKKPILPTEEELAVNKRSKSAKLRVFVRATSETSQPVRRSR